MSDWKKTHVRKLVWREVLYGFKEMYFDTPDLLILEPFCSMTTLLLLTRYLSSGTKWSNAHELSRRTNVAKTMICSRLPCKDCDFAAKVIIIPLHDLGHGEIATADENHVAEMGVIDSGTVGVADGFKYLSAQTHVKGFLGQNVGI